METFNKFKLQFLSISCTFVCVEGEVLANGKLCIMKVKTDAYLNT